MPSAGSEVPTSCPPAGLLARAAGEARREGPASLCASFRSEVFWTSGAGVAVAAAGAAGWLSVVVAAAVAASSAEARG